VLGVDIEAPSIVATRENAARNGVDLEVQLVAPGDRLPEAQAAVANISIAAVRALPRRTAASTLITSGYFLSETPDLEGYERVERRTHDGWAADLHRRS